MSITTAADGIKEVRPPLSDADAESLKAGDRVRITGVMYTARDAAHARLLPLMDAGMLSGITTVARGCSRRRNSAAARQSGLRSGT